MDIPMIDRRRLMLSSAGLGLTAVMPAMAQTPAASEDARLHALLLAQFEDGLNRSPESATSLGLDVGPRAAQRGQLNNRSVAAFQAEAPRNRERLDRLRGINAEALSPEGRLSYDVALFQRELAVDYARFRWHTPDGWRQTPYGVSQLGGAYATVPDFLDSTHPIEKLDDVEGFLNRLDAFPTALDQDTERMLANAEMGVIAPDFVLDKTRLQLIALRDQPGEDQAMVRSLVRRSTEKGLPNFGEGAARLFDGRVRNALSRQIEAVEALRLRSSHQAGVLRVPDGEAYYALNLRNFTTTDYAPADIHRIGLEQVADLQGQIDVLLKGEGYTQGTVAERLAGLRTEARFRFANTDAGREELLAFVNAEMASIRARMPEVFPRIPRNDFVVRRVPPAIEAGAPGGYAQGGSLDGSRPGIYYINLRDTAEWPRWTLKTLTYHEAAPCSRAPWRARRANCRSTDAWVASPPMARDGACIPSGWPMSWASMTATRLAASAIWRASCSAPAVWSSIPACTPRTGAASGPSGISPRTWAIRTSPRSNATASPRVRPAATRSARPSSPPCGAV
jgi:uncharacterized protein (DUF885 family)